MQYPNFRKFLKFRCVFLVAVSVGKKKKTEDEFFRSTASRAAAFAPLSSVSATTLMWYSNRVRYSGGR